jgi:hypothetical protein
MGFDFYLPGNSMTIDDTKDNYIRFPSWLFSFFNPFDSKNIIMNKLQSFKKKYKKSKFCALIADHDDTGIRTPLYELLSKIAPVDCPGKLFYNDNSLKELFIDDKARYLQQYKFNICPEDSVSPGYVTEKIFQALYSGCIPIYTGWNKDPEPDIINTNIILWYDLTLDNTKLFNEILKFCHINYFLLFILMKTNLNNPFFFFHEEILLDYDYPWILKFKYSFLSFLLTK